MEGALKLREVVDREAIKRREIKAVHRPNATTSTEDESFCSKAEDTDTAPFPELRRKQKSSVMLWPRFVIADPDLSSEHVAMGSHILQLDPIPINYFKDLYWFSAVSCFFF